VGIGIGLITHWADTGPCDRLPAASRRGQRTSASGPRSSRDSSTWPRAESVPSPWTSSTSTRLGIYTSVLALNRSVSADGRSTCGALIA